MPKITYKKLERKFSELSKALKEKYKEPIRAIQKKNPELKDNLKDAYSSHVYELSKSFVKYFTQEVDQYKDTLNNLKEKEGLYFAHYTSINTIHSILKDFKKNKKETRTVGLRLYAASEMSDPIEGTFLKNEFESAYPWLTVAKDISKAFICSFVSSKTEDVGDYITYWQAYGKDGLGCSIQPNVHNGLREKLLRVRYGKKEVVIVREKFEAFFDYGREIYQKLNAKDQKDFATDFWGSFDSIKFLYKHIGYEKEAEYRYVTKPEDNEIVYDLNHIDNDLVVRSYITMPELDAGKTLNSGSTIYIGPSVHNPQTVCGYLKDLAKKQNLPGLQFESSNILYRIRR